MTMVAATTMTKNMTTTMITTITKINSYKYGYISYCLLKVKKATKT